MKSLLLQKSVGVVLIGILLGCSKPDTEELINNAVHAITSADTIQTFIAEANCQGPKGSYTTVVHSETDYTYFKQSYSYNSSPFEAVIVNDSAFQIANDSIGSSFGKETIAALRSHEFHMILIDLKERFHQFGKPEYVSDQIKITGLDNLNNPIEIFFGKDAPEIQSITMRNPGDTTERINFSYTDWNVTQGIKLPMRVTIKQGTDKTFTFDFTKVEVNSKSFRRWKE